MEKKSVYQPDQQGLIFPEQKEFTTVAELREHRKERLAVSCRVLARMGYDYGFAGHLTIRDPENKDTFWTNPFAVPFSHVKKSNLILVDHNGQVIQGDYAVNRAGFVLHAAIHDKNPEVLASVHAHTTHGMAWASSGRPLDPITQTACGFYEDQAVITEDAGAVVVEKDSRSRVAEAFGNAKIAIHQNHGIFSAGRESIDEATWWFIATEKACEIQLKAGATGSKIQHIKHEAAVHSKKTLATPYMAWLHFQPIVEETLRREPDVLL